MSKETISQTEGLCKEVANCIRNAYDRGYKQGEKDGYRDGQNIEQSNAITTKEEIAKMEYERGLNVAWECARKIALRKDEARNAFHDVAPVKVFEGYSVSEAMAKIKEYEEKQKAEDTDSEIKTGDEVIYDNNKGIACGEPFPVGIDEELFVDVWFGSCMIRTMLKYVKKTGKHYYHVPEILKQLKGER